MGVERNFWGTDPGRLTGLRFAEVTFSRAQDGKPHTSKSTDPKWPCCLSFDKLLSQMNQSKIDALDRGFGIPNLVEVLSGNGGLPKIRVTVPSASAEIYLHGAQLTSGQPVDADEVLFLSEHSSWQDGRAIRGGIPVCFPWFRSKADDPSAPAHGVVRTKEWQLESVKIDGESIVVAFSTENDESTQRLVAARVSPGAQAIHRQISSA